MCDVTKIDIATSQIVFDLLVGILFLHVISSNEVVTWVQGMLSEVINALFVTFLATEYIGEIDARRAYADRSTRFAPLAQRRIGIVFSIVLFVNIFDSLTGIGSMLHALLEALYHIPKVFVVMFFYIVSLYMDCLYTLRQHHQSFSFWRNFLPRVIRLFICIRPVYPILAVGISFIFLFLISLFELLRIPTDVLNAPIYYGLWYLVWSLLLYLLPRETRRCCRGYFAPSSHTHYQMGEHENLTRFSCIRIALNTKKENLTYSCYILTVLVKQICLGE